MQGAYAIANPILMHPTVYNNHLILFTVLFFNYDLSLMIFLRVCVLQGLRASVLSAHTPSTEARCVMSRRISTAYWESHAQPHRKRSRKRTIRSERHFGVNRFNHHFDIIYIMSRTKIRSFDVLPSWWESCNYIGVCLSRRWRRNTIPIRTRTTRRLKRSSPSWQKRTRSGLQH